MPNLEAMREYLMRESQIHNAEDVLSTRFSEDEVKRIKAEALSRAHRSTGPNSEVYVSGLRWAVFMSNEKKPLQDILTALKED